MPNYRRAHTKGASYFFTVVSYQRQAILCEEHIRTSLRQAIQYTQSRYPFTIEAWVLLPDHLHSIWTLPDGDSDYAKRWGIIKRKVSLDCAVLYKQNQRINDSKRKHRESTLWQRRYWEHQINDQNDFNHHMDYIHYNPVKHGLCIQPKQWPYSTLHKLMKQGVYPETWAGSGLNDEMCNYGE